MNSTTLAQSLAQVRPLFESTFVDAPGEEEKVQALITMLPDIADPRHKRGLRYDLTFLLTCLIVATLCNCDSTEAIAQWCQAHQSQLQNLFGPRRFLTPCGSLFRRLLARLEPSSLEEVLTNWVNKLRTDADSEPIALDGKVVRGARTDAGDAPQLLSFHTHHTHETLYQVRVSDKTNEIPVAQAAIPLISGKGRVYTADALHTQVETARVINESGNDYLFTVKGNQPTLEADLKLYFADPQAKFSTARSVDLARGRKDVREIKVSSEMNDYLSKWPAIAQVAELKRSGVRGGKEYSETVYQITSLSDERADALKLLELGRGHWSVENSSHHVRDVTFGEDASRLRAGDAPQIMAALRNLAITLIHRYGSSKIAATRRHFSYFPEQALSLVSGRLP